MNARIYQARTDSEKAARRQEILAAAESLWLERGLKGATLGEVAERAGIGKGTVYLYFDGLEDMKRAVKQHLREAVAIWADDSIGHARRAALLIELCLELDRDGSVRRASEMHDMLSASTVALAMAGKE